MIHYILGQPFKMGSPKHDKTTIDSETSILSIRSKIVEVFIDTDDEEVEIIDELLPISMREHPVQEIE